jgi:hypothetical protein
MRARAVALGILALALAVHVWVARPAREAVASSADAFRRAREERRGAELRLLAAQRREADAERARQEFRAAGGHAVDALAGLHRDAVAAADQAGVSALRLSVRPGRGAVAATLHVSAEGSFDRASRLAEDLATTRGVVLQEVRLSTGPRGVSVEVDGGRLAEKAPAPSRGTAR